MSQQTIQKKSLPVAWNKIVSNMDNVAKERQILAIQRQEEEKYPGLQDDYDKLDQEISKLNEKRKDFSLNPYVYERKLSRLSYEHYYNIRDEVEKLTEELNKNYFYWVILKKDSKARIRWDTNSNGGSMQYPEVNVVVKTREEGVKSIKDAINKLYDQILAKRGRQYFGYEGCVSFQIPIRIVEDNEKEEEEYEFRKLIRE